MTLLPVESPSEPSLIWPEGAKGHLAGAVLALYGHSVSAGPVVLTCHGDLLCLPTTWEKF